MLLLLVQWMMATSVVTATIRTRDSTTTVTNPPHLHRQLQQQRSVLVIRILEQAEDSVVTMELEQHQKLRAVLFDGRRIVLCWRRSLF
jgi:hypothetical protein